MLRMTPWLSKLIKTKLSFSVHISNHKKKSKGDLDTLLGGDALKTEFSKTVSATCRGHYPLNIANYSGPFTQEGTKMVIEHMQKCSILLVIREMQINLLHLSEWLFFFL